MDYTIDYFIEKFEAIPEDKWCTGQYANSLGARCALGHCGQRSYEGYMDTEEAKALILLFPIKKSFIITAINDGDNKSGTFRFGKTPKERIINALKELKNANKLS